MNFRGIFLFKKSVRVKEIESWRDVSAGSDECRGARFDTIQRMLYRTSTGPAVAKRATPG